jgi:threonine dehydrogenase-like Zn-dependent dehydrogenase
VKAVSFAAPVPRYLFTRAAGALSQRLYVGRHACTRYGDVPEPAQPGEQWVRIRTLLGGICGSDLAVVTLAASPATSPFSSFPFVLGHEGVGEIIEIGSQVSGFTAGERVAVNPLLGCRQRGIDPPCAACASGQPSRCIHFTDGALPPGMLIGTTRGLGGSWGERFVAHVSQLIRIPEKVPIEAAVLAEPLACSLHAVRASGLVAGDRVLVVGAGSIGLLTVTAIKAVVPETSVTLLARYRFQASHGQRLGADKVVLARGKYGGELAQAGQTRLLQPILGGKVGVGGFDASFVCVPAKRAVEDALCFTRAGGTLVLLGNTTRLDGVDWTPLWLKELTLRGSLCYGVHVHDSQTQNAFDEAMQLIATERAPVGPLLTHVFPLADVQGALMTALDKSGAQCVKVALRPG